MKRLQYVFAFCALLLGAGMAYAAAASSSPYAVRTVSRTTNAMEAGTAWMKCNVPVHYKAVSSPSSTASTSDPLYSHVDVHVPVELTAGQRIAILAQYNSGTCWVSKSSDAIVGQTLTVADAGVVNLTVSGTCTGCGGATPDPLGVGEIVVGTRISAPVFDGGAVIGTTANFSGASKAASYQATGIVNGSEVWSDKFDGGSVVATTINTSGKVVAGDDIHAKGGACFQDNSATGLCMSDDGSHTSILLQGSFHANGSMGAYQHIQTAEAGSGNLIIGSGGGMRVAGRCDQRGDTSYPNTCNQMAGKGRIASGSGSAGFDINNGLVLGTGAICMATFAAQNAGCTTITCAADAGNMTFDTNANCSGSDADFDWFLLSTQ